MGIILPKRAGYRVRQFALAVAATLTPLTNAELAEVAAYLPEEARQLF
jgi:hypothetical protein